MRPNHRMKPASAVIGLVEAGKGPPASRRVAATSLGAQLMVGR